MQFKKILAMMFIVILIMIPVIAKSNIELKINDHFVAFDQSTGIPFIDDNNRTQVPFRASMNAIGAKVQWDNVNRVAIATKDNTRIDVPIGKAHIFVNQQKKLNDTQAMIVNGRTFLPIRIVMESFGFTVSWDNANQTVIATSKTQTQAKALPQKPIPQTFGVRHDINLSEYEALAKTKSNDRPDFSPVVAIKYTLDRSDDYEYIATGTLIAPQWILTAGHNFYIREERTTPAKEADIEIIIGTDPNRPSAIYGVEKIVFHPTWMGYNDNFYYGNDYALIKLTKPVKEMNPAPLMRSKDEIIGSVVWFAGFGDYSQTVKQNPDLYSPKHAIENVLDRKKDGITSMHNDKTYTGGYLAFDFDDPTGNSNTFGDQYIGIDERQIGLGTSDNYPRPFEGATVEGDSGGPLFVYDKGIWRVAGVLSGGAHKPTPNHIDSNYGDISIFMRVSTQIKWIDSVINAN